MNDNVRKIFEILGVEPNEKFKVKEYDRVFEINEELCLLDRDNNVWNHLLIKILKNPEYIIKLPKEPKKKKLRDLTKEEWDKWLEKNCKNNICDKCIFNNVVCSDADCSWVNHKYLYSDAFLNKEIEVE